MLNIGVPLLCAVCLLFAAQGCTSKRSEMGVENCWRENSAPVFETGRTTQSDVMQALGPPSQVIGLKEQTIFYYLREQSESSGLTLIIYNQTRERITYDRAIYIFDRRGVLTDFAASPESIPVE